MLLQVIASGQGGMKATIEAIKNEVISQDKVLFVNSTGKDIPNEYRSNSVIFSEDGLGCAKNRVRARKLVIDAINEGRLNLDQWIMPTTNCVVLVTSTDGGSGSGSVPVIADYIYNVLNKKVHIIGFDGFDLDVTGYKNRVDFFKDLSDEYTIECICNSKFLSEANGDIIKAEHLANVEFATRLNILQGTCIVESDHNIDEADLMKTILTPGFMNIEYAQFPARLKNSQEFNNFLRTVCDNTKSFDIINPSQKRMAVIINHNVTDTSVFDWSFDILKERFGNVDNVFLHLQKTDASEFIAIINAGLNMPIEAIEEIYNKYTTEKQKVNRAKDNFYSTASTMFNTDDDNEDDDSDIFNSGNTVAATTSTNKSMFFGGTTNKFTNKHEKVKVVKEEDIKDNY